MAFVYFLLQYCVKTDRVCLYQNCIIIYYYKFTW